MFTVALQQYVKSDFTNFIKTFLTYFNKFVCNFFLLNFKQALSKLQFIKLQLKFILFSLNSSFIAFKQFFKKFKLISLAFGIFLSNLNIFNLSSFNISSNPSKSLNRLKILPCLNATFIIPFFFLTSHGLFIIFYYWNCPLIQLFNFRNFHFLH